MTRPENTRVNVCPEDHTLRPERMCSCVSYNPFLLMIKSLDSEIRHQWSTPKKRPKRYWTMWCFYGGNESHWQRSEKARVEYKPAPCGKNWRMSYTAVLMCKWLFKWVTFISYGLFVREKPQSKLLWMMWTSRLSHGKMGGILTFSMET